MYLINIQEVVRIMSYEKWNLEDQSLLFVDVSFLVNLGGVTKVKLYGDEYIRNYGKYGSV